ncbi:unnamed protein product [Closterium sp. Yama58-4]|nr:unnamed protein product [Closterium sp. Yama58-4]
MREQSSAHERISALAGIGAHSLNPSTPSHNDTLSFTGLPTSQGTHAWLLQPSHISKTASPFHVLIPSRAFNTSETARSLSVATHSPALGSSPTSDTGTGRAGVNVHPSSLRARRLHASAPTAVAAAVGGSPNSDTGTGKAGVKALQPSPRASNEHAGEAGRSKLVEAFQIQAASDPMRGFMVALRKSELSFETGLALRDLRVVISALQNQIPTILIRPRAIVVSLAHVRAVITANRAYVLNTSSPRPSQPVQLGQPGQSDQKTQGEALLGEGDARFRQMGGEEGEVGRGVDGGSGVGVRGERREQQKGRVGEEGDRVEHLGGRGRTVELEGVSSGEAVGSGGEASGRGAGDGKANTRDGSGRDTQGSTTTAINTNNINNSKHSPHSTAALSIPRLAPTPFEFQVLEALLDEVGVTLKVKYASIFPGVYQGLRAFAGGRVPYERAMAEQEAFLRAKNELLRLEMSANQICNAVREVLSNDEDMAEMYLSRKAALLPGTTNCAEHSEVEELLEDHLRRMEEVVGEAEQLLSMSDATSEYLRTALDSARNQLIELDVLVNMATCSLAVGGSIAAVFVSSSRLHSLPSLQPFCASAKSSPACFQKSTITAPSRIGCIRKRSSAPGKCNPGSSSVSRQRRRVGGRGVVAASPPTEEVEVRTEPLTKEDLVNYLRSGCKPKDKWRIGTEHEKFGFDQKTLQPMTYEQIATLLEHIADRFSWDKIMEGDRIIGLRSNGQSVTLEPGGQFELSGAPLETVHQTCAEVNGHLYQVKSICEEEHVGFLGLGFNPKHALEEIPIMPKGRYTIMRNYMPKVGSLGLEMMFRTCTVQVNLDFDSEQDMVDKFRVGLALQPVATALFANSPFLEGKPNGYLSYRSRVWEDTDKDRTGDLPFVFEEGFGFERYVEYALDVPMYFAYRDQRYIDATGLSFRDFLNGKLPVLPGAYPSLNDWENHLTTIFPEVRLKRYLEMRGADGGSWRRICALPAFWVGLLYDRQALDECKAIIADWTELERSALRTHVPRLALKTPFREGLLQHLAQDLVRISKEGLQRRGYREANFLKELENIAATGVTPAERMLEAYHGSESAMSWIRSNLAKVGTFAGSVVQKAGDAVERGAKMVYEQAESAVVGRPHNSFRHAVRRIEEVASYARGSERKEALARWLAALSDIQQEIDRLQAHFQRRKKKQVKGERKAQEENRKEEVMAESAASAEGSAETGASGAAAEAAAGDAGAAVSSGRTEGVGAEGAVTDRAGGEGNASVTEGDQAKEHGEAQGVDAGTSEVQADGAEAKSESVAAESGGESKDWVVGDGADAKAGSKSEKAGDIAAAGEEAEEVASIGDGSSQDEAAPSLTKSASTGRASMVLFYDPDAGNEALNFRDVFLRSSALELIVASVVVAPGDEDEMALLRGLFGLCLNLSSTQCDDLLTALQSLGCSLSAYSELKLPSDDLATMVAEAITGLKVNPEIERVDLESCRLQQLIAEAASVAASVPAAHQRSASFVAAFDLDDLATDATSAGAVAPDAADAVDAADATSGAVSAGSRGGDDDGGGGGGADGGDTASSGQASTETAASGSAASSSEPAAPAEADGAAAAPATTAKPIDIQSEPAANAAASPPPHTMFSPPPHVRDAVTHVNEVVTARSRDALRLGLRLLALEKKKEALLQMGDTPGDRALKVERVSCLAAELSEGMEGLRKKAEECRQQRQEALAYRSSKAQEAREAEKVLLAEAQQVQKRKEELEEELRRVQAALDGVNRRLVKLEEEKELFSQASSGIEAHLSSEEESLMHSLVEHEEDAKALAGWKQFLQQSWQLQQASMEGKERQLREEMSDRKSRFWEMAQGHVRLCKSELEAFGHSAKSIVERLNGIRAKREQAEKEGKDGAVSDSKHRRLQWEERYMAAEIQVKRCIGEAEIAMREIRAWLDSLTSSEDSSKQAQMRSLLAELESLVASVRASERPSLSLDHPTVLRVQRLGKSPDSWASAEAAAAGRGSAFPGTVVVAPLSSFSAAAGAGGAAPTGTEENVPPTPFVISGGVRRPVAPGFKDKQGKSKMLQAGESGLVQSKQGKESFKGNKSMGEEKEKEGRPDGAAETGSAEEL